MPQKTNLNVAPYYDDFNSASNFNRVLFRPGYAVQGRELTQLQSTLQNQIEKHGNHIFEEGSMVIPGQVSFNRNYKTLKFSSTFASENIDISEYYNSTTDVTITGATSGVKARVIGYAVGSSTEQPVLFIRYTETGSDYTTMTFTDGENISADAGITHTTTYATNVASATVFTATSTTATDAKGPAAATGSAANITAGVYYVRGMFVENTAQEIVISKYDNTTSARVGFTISETLVTPESDSTLTDNATGSNNYAAKGAHRLKITLTLATLPLTSTADSTFIELMRIKEGIIQHQVRATQYSVIEETFARRTFDESGDYTVRPFQFVAHESITIDDEVGVYTSGVTTDDGNTATNSMIALKVSPGKAYIKGIELEKMAPTIKDINKARDTDSVNNGVSQFTLGNYTLITNVYHQPDITNDGGTITDFLPVYFYDAVTTSRAAAAGTAIGSGRVRHMEYSSGTNGSVSGNYTSKYKLYVFDIKPYTKLTMSGTISATLLVGDFITGSTSGATGYIVDQSSAVLMVTSVVGSFSTGETIIVSDRASATSETISTIRTYSFADFKQVHQVPATSTINFSADLSLEEDTFNLTGTSSTPNASTALNGIGTRYASELVAGDTVEIPDAGASNVVHTSVVASVTSDVAAVLTTATHSGDGLSTNVVVVRKRAKLSDTEKNVGIIKLPKNVIKTTSDHTYSVRRQHVITLDSSAKASLPTLTNETYGSTSASADYTLSIISEASGSATEIGSIVGTLTFDNVGGGTAQAITYTNAAQNDVVKVVATVSRNSSVDQKTKTPDLSKSVKVVSAGNGVYGTFSDDKTISLGRADVFKLQAVYDSEDTGADAAPPSFNGSTVDSGAFTKGEVITGSVSGAKGRVITAGSSGPWFYVKTSETGFTTTDVITGAYSTTVTTGALTLTIGSVVITSNYLLDTGQRDNYYDVSRIVRKSGVPVPTGRLLIIHDYLAHSGSGDYFSVNSYVTGSTGVSHAPTVAVNQMDYNDIPEYSATKVDPDARQPTGLYKLADSYDFRPTVANITGTQTSDYPTNDIITANSFDFASRVFHTGSGYSNLNFPKANTDVQSDFDYYLNRRALVYMNKRGIIEVKEGASSEVPQLPRPNDGAMLLARLYIPAYTFFPKDVIIVREKNQRFTMKDIGKLKDRIDHIEYYTALNMLERDTESYEIQDANGLNRFKSGFIVDNCTGHRVGDVQHVDYKISMDIENGLMRPKHKAEAVALENSVASGNTSTNYTDTSAHWEKTGDLITLPYTEEEFTSQPYATRCEKVSTMLSSTWLGIIDLSPASDEWFETEIAPKLVTNVEGNYDTFLAANEDQIGTIWNSWQTGWHGVVSITHSNQFADREWQGYGNANRTTTTVRSDMNRTGVKTEVLTQFDEETQGSRKLYDTSIPFCRSITLTFVGYGFRPRTRVYPFFDKKAISSYVTPLSSTYSSDATPVAASPLITTSSGKVEGTFTIPDPKTSGNPKWETGEIQFRLTSNSTNAHTPTPETAADVIWFAKGILETHQESIISTRNARVVQTSVNQTTSVFSSSHTDARGWAGEAEGTSLGQGWSCFVAGTLVRLADGSDKKIEDVKINDLLLGMDGVHNKVLEFDHPMLDGRNLIGINGSGTFMTPEHPIMTKDGWKAFDSELTKIEKSELAHLMVNGNLEVGDEIFTVDNKWMEIKSLEVFENEPQQQVYNFVLDGSDNTYFVDGLLAHNKEGAGSGAGGGDGGSGEGGAQLCFVAGTLVRFADGSDKKIEDVKINDLLLGMDGAYNTVLELHHPMLDGRNLIGINGSGTFITPEHPLMTKDGWKAYDIEKSELDYLMVNGNLKVGDEILTVDNEWMAIKSLEVFENEPQQQVYNFVLDGNNTYFADGLLTHNKDPRDPLGQTFMVNKKGGAFITSVDLYFCTKDETLPMWVEIRNVINGYPGPKILPFGRKVLEPADVTISDGASVATKVTFPSPVYVEEGMEYTIALMTAAQINSWSVWISRMGEEEIGGIRAISTQPHVGVLFKSANNTAWAMSGMEDLKFTLNIAKFDATKSGILTLQNATIPSRKLKKSPIEFTHGDATVRVKHRDHGMYATSNNVTIAGVSSGITTTLANAITTTTGTTIDLTSGTNFDDTTGKYKRDTNSTFWIKIDDEIISYTAISTNQITSATRGANSTTAANHIAGTTVELYMLYAVPFTEVNKTHTAIANVGGVALGNSLDTYTFELQNSHVPALVAATGSILFGENSVTATENHMIDTAQTLIGVLELPETKLEPKIRPTTATSASGTQTSFTTLSESNAITIPLNDNHHFDVPYMVASGINETNEMAGVKSLFLPITMTSTNKYLSPVIDIDRLSLICVSNRLNKITGTSPYTYGLTADTATPSTDPEGDDNAAVYMTKEVLLENPATALRVLFASQRETGAEILTMYKILRTDDASDFDDIGWTYFNSATAVSTNNTDSIVKTSVSGDYQQYVYTAGITDDGTGTPLDSFIAFSIKMVLRGTNSAKPPKIKDIRAIALAT